MNNKVYLYDNSFINLLNLINYLIENNIRPNNIKNNDYFPNLFEKTLFLKVNQDENIIYKIINLIGLLSFKKLYCVFLSNNENKELIMYYFLLNSLKYKDKVIYMRNLNCVSEVLRISNYVKQESHKLKGFLRFKELNNNMLYAEMEPENDILFFLSLHFKERLKNEYWIIKDIKRGILSIYDKKKFYFVLEEDFKFSNIILSKNEKEIEKLWKEFYITVGIKERKNDRCRMNFMPKKYWKYIIEMSDE